MPPFIVMDILEKAKEMEARGEKIIHLEIGEPDFDTPESIKKAARRALRDGDTHYTHSLGKPELREEIARYYLRKYGVSISPDQIIVTSGTSPAMLITITPGIDFGRNCEGYIRLSYANSLENIKEGLDRLECFLS
ncbi:aminotransferase class I/II-fold pyridoxal phosphate-dependent enzyme [Moorella naiadis]|uniref:aminotransferase class I/II-fold pyridoxal phosphate-dependent enzyme n=1 Tax=Moorella naiadis (nom. illeg.) TaxID=3093670 RepID=UPI003D9CBD81